MKKRSTPTQLWRQVRTVPEQKMASWVGSFPWDEHSLWDLLDIVEKLLEVHETTRAFHLAAVCQGIARTQGLSDLSGEAHLQMARARVEQQEFEEAWSLLDRAEADLKEADGGPSLCQVMIARGDIELGREHLQRALHHYRLARECASKDGFAREEGDALWRMASTYLVWEDDDRAREHFLLALPLFQEVGALSEVARVHRNLADIEWINDRNDAAERGYSSALEIDREDNPEGAGHDLMGLGEILAETGDMDGAIRSFSEALRFYELVGDLVDQARAHWRLANVCSEAYQLDQTVEHLRRSIALSAELGDAHQEALACASLGSIYLDRGDRKRAIELVQRAESLSPGVAKEIAEGPSKRER